MRKPTRWLMAAFLITMALSAVPAHAGAGAQNAWVRETPQTAVTGERINGSGPESIYVSYSATYGITVQTVDAEGKVTFVAINTDRSNAGITVFGDNLVTANNFGSNAYFIHAPNYNLREVKPAG